MIHLGIAVLGMSGVFRVSDLFMGHWGPRTLTQGRKFLATSRKLEKRTPRATLNPKWAEISDSGGTGLSAVRSEETWTL